MLKEICKSLQQVTLQVIVANGRETLSPDRSKHRVSIMLFKSETFLFERSSSNLVASPSFEIRVTPYHLQCILCTTRAPPSLSETVTLMPMAGLRHRLAGTRSYANRQVDHLLSTCAPRKRQQLGNYKRETSFPNSWELKKGCSQNPEPLSSKNMNSLREQTVWSSSPRS
jgi:hypothetical protein